jgi:Phosphatidylinositol transfer protein
MDRWHGLTMDDIRAIEDETKKELDKVCILRFLLILLQLDQFSYCKNILIQFTSVFLRVLMTFMISVAAT